MFKSSDKEVSLMNSKDRDRFYNKFTEEQKILFDSVKNTSSLASFSPEML